MIKHGTAEAYRDRAFFVLRHGAVEVVLCISIADMQLGELGLLENTQETETLQILNGFFLSAICIGRCSSRILKGL